MKVGVVSPYLSIMGGGERYVLTVAEFFLTRNDTVEIFSKDNINPSEIKDRFDLDLTGANFRKGWHRWQSTIAFDLMFFLSDGSIPMSFAAKNILHFQTPFNYINQRTLANKLKLSRFLKVVCNSQFTKRFVDQTYGIDSDVIYPPVDVEKFRSGKKENIIISVGRFFAKPQAKKQEVMIEVFKRMKIPGWRLVLIGGVDRESAVKVEGLHKLARGGSVEIITDVQFGTLRDYYSRAKIFWHAAGLGEDIEQFPEKAEHFGISTVEAMASGCVPIVFAGGGQLEIVDDGQNGYFWKDIRELVLRTEIIIGDEQKRKIIARNAAESSTRFNKEKFYQHLGNLLK